MSCFVTFSLVVSILVNVILFPRNCTQDPVRAQAKSVTLTGCDCEGLECNCCANLDLANTPRHEVCLKITVIPNEVTLRGTLVIDGQGIFTGQLDPSSAPLCAPMPPLCLAINHVDLQKRQICTKLSLLILTLIKFPCVGAEDGLLVVQPNIYN